MNSDMKLYYDYTISPLGKVFYNTVWSQLKNINNCKVLDFGSGFCFTSDYLAKNNDVTAIEVNKDIIDVAIKSESFKLLNGDIDTVKEIENESFDVVICHLVLEFVDNPREMIAELLRVLKKGGNLSLVRHNRNGRIIQAIVQDYDIDDAHKLLDGEHSFSSAFGFIKYYENNDVLDWLAGKAVIEKVYGVRTVASLHDDKLQDDLSWVAKMSEIESRLVDKPEFINIAYFNHLIIKK